MNQVHCSKVNAAAVSVLCHVSLISASVSMTGQGRTLQGRVWQGRAADAVLRKSHTRRGYRFVLGTTQQESNRAIVKHSIASWYHALVRASPEFAIKRGFNACCYALAISLGSMTVSH